MRAEQYVSVIVTGLTFIALVFGAGLFFNSPWLIRLSVLTAAAMYLTQAGDAIQAEYVGSPAATVAGFIIVIAWGVALLLALVAILVVLCQ